MENMIDRPKYRRVYSNQCSRCPRKYKTYVFTRATNGLCGVCRRQQDKVSPGQAELFVGAADIAAGTDKAITMVGISLPHKKKPRAIVRIVKTPCCSLHDNLDDAGIECGLSGKGDREDSFCCKKCPERSMPVRKILR